MKRYGALATGAFLILACASVWLGGLNQDEGWYLYAANLVSEGRMPYRDFFYTQGPLLPLAYSAFTGAWEGLGILGGRIVTLSIGFLSIVFAAALARMLATEERRGVAGVLAFTLLGCNLYHVYYLTIPKTYALASLFLIMGFYLLAFALVKLGVGQPAGLKVVSFRGPDVRTAPPRRNLTTSIFGPLFLFSSGLTMAFAAGARVSTGAALAVVGFALLINFRRYRWSFAWFGLGGLVALGAVYGPFLVDSGAREGVLAAQRYHAARGGFDPVFTVGSVSRLVRWYLPVFIMIGLGSWRRGIGIWLKSMSATLVLATFLAVFAVQVLAPYPYEDYQVPIMGLLVVWAAVRAVEVPKVLLLAIGLTWASSFGSPLLEKWMTNGQDRFWTLKKEKTELGQLQDMAKVVEAIDPGGKEILTQDLYLAIEANRKVPEGLEMGPFSMLTDAEWRGLLESAPCEVAALSGYSFAIEPPVCTERPIDVQMSYWGLLKRNYDLVMKEDAFGQNATTLLILKRKPEERRKGESVQ